MIWYASHIFVTIIFTVTFHNDFTAGASVSEGLTRLFGDTVEGEGTLFTTDFHRCGEAANTGKLNKLDYVL